MKFTRFLLVLFTTVSCSIGVAGLGATEPASVLNHGQMYSFNAPGAVGLDGFGPFSSGADRQWSTTRVFAPYELAGLQDVVLKPQSVASMEPPAAGDSSAFDFILFVLVLAALVGLQLRRSQDSLQRSITNVASDGCL